MIGKPSWFQIRKYGGWGITPRTWQGWVYIFVAMIPVVVTQTLLEIDEKTKTTILFVWLALFIFDCLDIMIHLKKDEREYIHEAIAERNASWFMVAAITVGFFYQSISSALKGAPNIDLFLLIPLLGGALVKSITGIYLRNK